MPPADDLAIVRQALALLVAHDWQAAHVLVQPLESPTAAWLHGIVHLMEGDVDNARYWYSLAGQAFPGRDAAATEIVRLGQSLPPA